jgi:hypothetical protein
MRWRRAWVGKAAAGRRTPKWGDYAGKVGLVVKKAPASEGGRYKGDGCDWPNDRVWITPVAAKAGPYNSVTIASHSVAIASHTVATGSQQRRGLGPKSGVKPPHSKVGRLRREGRPVLKKATAWEGGRYTS